MSFEVIPALDVAGGRLVRIDRSGEIPVEAFESDPLTAASAFVRAGATRLHMVDVDLARSGEVENLPTLRAVCQLGVPVQASGGVRSRAHVEGLLSAGAERVVLGSAALADRDEAEVLSREFGERLVVGIEADGPVVKPRGSDVELALLDLLEWLARIEVCRYLFTEVGRVGALEGPDLDGIRAFAEYSAVPVLLAGGIRGVDDVRAVAALGGRIEGVVIGRALYEGLGLEEALAAIS
jgi:phosphoribosylformimino-5-aminoimidazole carboxamide ribonucleotide (ProFAR) isomerase